MPVASSPADAQISAAVDVLRAGGVIAYPTEGVWGLGCDPSNPAAVEKLMVLKGRALDKGLILIVSALEQLSSWVNADLRASAIDALAYRDPYPITWIVQHGGATPQWLSGGRDTVAIRLTQHPVAAALCRQFGSALVSTSANPSGLDAAKTKSEVLAYFDTKLDVIVSGELGAAAGPSEIRDLASGKILRKRVMN